MNWAEGLIISALFISLMLAVNCSGSSSSPEKGQEEMNRSEITTSWNLSSLFQDRGAAIAEFE
ncbi:MAG: hypothetical protein LUQ02_02915, partial [Methanothrix sp.]|nr:hypothetical protein [Methanothrix sp.]